MPDYNLPVEMLPRVVPISVSFAPFEIHVFPGEFGLYWTLPGNIAVRYVVGIGRPGLYEAGEFYVGAKKEWPSWTPTPGMLRREPGVYSRWRDGMPGGLNNPLGSRALYLFQPGRGDTFLRIHGTNDPSTLARRVSNGCARMVNDQMIDLYDRVPMDTRVVLYPPTA
nr:L,D-transpeptidase [Puniceibacterium antarcticum]